MNNSKKILLIALGNDILGDDGVAIEAAEILKNEFNGQIDFESVYGGGLELLDILEGRENVIIIDTIISGCYPQGTIRELSIHDFSDVISGSPHYMGLPEVFRLSSVLDIPFPKEIKILAIEIEPQYEVREGLSPKIKKLLPDIVKKARTMLNEWVGVESY